MENKVKDTIKNITELSDEQLIHYYKCALSKKLASEKKLYAPLITAIEKERKKRGTTTITSAVKPKPPVGSASDMYEDEQ